MKKQLNIAVLRGGVSAEREVSLNSAREVIKALKNLGYKYFVYDPKTDLSKLIKDRGKIDVVLPILHGTMGEDGAIQGFLELLNLPYAFSDVSASVLGINKFFQHQLFEKNKIPIPKYQMVREISDRLKFLPPFVAKPNTQGSSVGVTVVRYKKDIKKALNLAFRYDKEVLVEEYIKGLEITVGVLGKGDNAKALPVVEIVPKKEFFDYQAKYDGTTEEIVPARIPTPLARRAQNYALKVHKLLGCSGVTRVDMILQASSYLSGPDPASRDKLQASKIYVLEINTIPGLTRESLIPKAARAAGISFEELIQKIIDIVLKKNKF